MTFQAFKQFFSAPVFPDEETARNAGLLSFLINLHILIGTGTALLLIIFTDMPPVFPLAAFFSTLPGFGLRFLMRTGRVVLSSALFVSLIFLLMPSVAWFGGSSVASVSVTVFQAITIVMAGLLLGGRGAAAFVVLTGLVNGIFIYAELKFHYVTDTSRDPVSIWFMQVVSFSAIAAMLFITNRLIRASFASARRENEERRAVESRLRSIVENSPSFILELDRGGIVKFANAETEKLLGVNIYQFTLPETRERIKNAIASVFETGKSVEIEERVISTSGVIRWNAIRLGPLYSSGEVVSVMATLDNINEKKEAELQARQRAEQLATIVEIGHAVSEVTDLKTILDVIHQQLKKLISFDAYSVRIFNKEKQTITYLAVYENGRYWDEPESKLEPGTDVYKVLEKGTSIMHLMTDEEIQQEQMRPYARIGDHSHMTTSLIFLPLKKLGETIGVLSVQRYESNSFTSDDLRLVEAVGIQVEIAIENARLFESIQHELQERIATEKIRERLINELEQKNAELERFTYTVSHDLRSPIVTIKGFVGMLEKDIRENRPDRVQSDIQRIAGASDKMDALLKDLLELSRIGRLVNPPEEIDTVRLIGDAIESVDAQLHAKNVTVNILPALPKLYGDRIRLREVFENLIANAAKYMGEQTSPLIEIGFKNHGSETIFYVKDNGIGIDPRYHTRIFNLFEKLNPTIEGTGIGLTLVKRIVEVHGGRVWVESDGLGKGSTFCFTIPDGRK